MNSILITTLVLLTSVSRSLDNNSQYIIQIKKDKLWGYIDIEGQTLIQPQFQKCEEFSKVGLAPVFDEKLRKWVFVRPNGDNLKFQENNLTFKENLGFNIEGFHDGLLAVRRDGKWGFVDKNGQMIIEPKYKNVSRFNGGFAWAERAKNFFIINKAGQEIALDLKELWELKNFSEDLMPFRIMAVGYGFLNSNGEIQIEPKFKDVGYFHQGKAWARDFNNKIGFIDTKGEWIIEPQFDVAFDFESESGLARVKQKNRWFYIDQSGKSKFVLFGDVFTDYQEGLAGCRKSGLYGFIDKNGNWVIAPKFEGVRKFHNGFAAAKQNDKWGIIDRSGKWVIEPIYDAIKDVEKIGY